MKEAGKITNNLKSQRIISDHMRTAVFMIADGVVPSNTDQGYILRRLIRRAVFNTTTRVLLRDSITAIVDALLATYGNVYENLVPQKTRIIDEIVRESEKFAKTIEQGTKEFEKMASNGNIDAFVLFSSYGFPIDMTIELGKQRGIAVDEEKFKEEFKKHQELSRVGAEQKFKGGLAGTGEMEVKYHTTTHLLHQALRDVLGTSVQQKGSNITAERLRFDFVHPQKMTDEEKKQVEDIVNAKIAEKLPMQKVIMKKEDAEKTEALHFFGDKYGEEVSVYFIGDSLDTAYSKEFCGGPHVTNTGELGHFKIAKEEAVSAGVRRIKAVLE